MTKTFFMIAAFSCMSLAAQKQSINILNSNDPHEIEAFLKTAQRDDPRKATLTRKLAALKSSKTPKPLQANATAPKSFSNPDIKFAGKQNEEEEFKRIASEKPGVHEQKTVKLLNQLFDNDVSNKDQYCLYRTIRAVT